MIPVETELLPLDGERYAASIERGGELIRRGGLVAFPTETVYGLGADAMNGEAVARIFEAKGRPQDNPLIVHISRAADVDRIAADVSPMARSLMEAFWPGPFTAVLKKRDCVPQEVTAGLDTVGIRLPALRSARDLIDASGTFIAAPSANLSGRPSPTLPEHVVEDMTGRADAILLGGACDVGVESTVCLLTGDTPVILRPGGVTAEMIEAVCGRAEVHPAVLDGELSGSAPSPGMKYRHYAPRASVYVVSGQDAVAIANKTNVRYNMDVEQGLSALILCAEEHLPLYSGMNAASLGADAEAIGRELFRALRQADEDGIDVIYFHAVDCAGLGLAVMNRIVRAAGFRQL